MSDETSTQTATQNEHKQSPSAILNNPNLKAPHFRDEDVKFSFKKRKTTAEETAAGTEPEKRAPVILTLPMLTFDGLVTQLENEKVANLILEAANDLIREAARQQVADEEKPVNRQSDLDLQKLTLDFIANLPKGERGGGISKETWEAFAKDYVTVMQTCTNKPVDKLEKAAAIFTKRLTPVQSEKPVLKFLQEQLSLWAAHTTDEELTEVFTFLDTKITTLLSKDSTALLEAL